MLHNIIKELDEYQQQLLAIDNNNPLLIEYGSKQLDQTHKKNLLNWLYSNAFHTLYIAKADGGNRRNWLQCWSNVVLATRRNINVMPSVMYSIGPMLLLEFYGAKQQYLTAVERLKKGEQYCFGLSERNTGTSIIGTQASARQSESGWQVKGKKGPIGWSDKTNYLLALVNTSDTGATGLSFMLLPLYHPSISFEPWQNIGMHGQTFGEISFDVDLPADALVGEQGFGLEYTLIIQQFVKFMSTAANVGAIQDILQKVTTAVHQAQGQRCLTDYSHVQYLLAKSYAQSMLMEATSLVCACLTNAPVAQMSVIASVSKQTALHESQQITAQLKDLLSVNSVLDTSPLFSSFRKLVDDLDMVRYIDTNPIVNLENIATQIPLIFLQRERLSGEKGIQQLTTLCEILCIDNAYFVTEKMKLAVTNSRGDWLVNAMKLLTNESLARDFNAQGLHVYCVAIDRALTELWQSFRAIDSESAYVGAKRIELARRYCQLVSLSAVVLLNISAKSPLLPLPILTSIIDLLLADECVIPESCQQIFSHLIEAVTQKRALSWMPVELDNVSFKGQAK